MKKRWKRSSVEAVEGMNQSNKKVTPDSNGQVEEEIVVEKENEKEKGGNGGVPKE